MRTCLSVLAMSFVFTQSAFAGLPQEARFRSFFEKQAKARGEFQAMSEAAPGQPTMPIRREASFRVRVEKTEVVSKADGGFEFVSNEVCKKSGKAHVYDATSGGSPMQSDTDILQCETTIGGEKAIVHLGGLLALTEGVVIDQQAASKWGYSFMWVETPGVVLPSDISSMWASAGSHDVGVRSLFFNLYPSVITQCEADAEPAPSTVAQTKAERNCKATAHEFVTATIAFED